ncbi:MAG: methylmalonyl Co-A mutase-associated GTPase MeaB [Cellvibrionales bacterium]|jgi:LAO/AO transport system kinase|nr:methylmalonyl Co-A mutase-associated GTPase MeaB [Cellvibrionales bacterium]
MAMNSSVDIDALRAGNRRALAKAITLVESKRDDHREQAQQLLETALPHTGNSIRIGITGVPGVGKSTFIEAFGLYLIAQGKKVAVLAVDPSSPVAGGSILGDKTRMEELSRRDEAFIRPSPSEGSLGGVAHKTRETMLLCEAAGYDVIIVETVGVGQSEYEVASMVDFFLVLMLPNAGDELQGIKRGIMELADGLVVNKADGDALVFAEQTRSHYRNALKLLKHPDYWQPRVVCCSALQHQGVDAVWQMVQEYYTASQDASAFLEKRAKQNVEWMKKLLHEMIDARLQKNPALATRLPSLQSDIVAGRVTPYSAARELISFL